MSELLYLPGIQPKEDKLPEIPDLGDPFMEMLFVIYELMPAALSLKESWLRDQGLTMEALADYQSRLSLAQDLFNDFYSMENGQMPGGGSPQDAAEQMLTILVDLREDLIAQGFIEGSPDDPDSLLGQMCNSLQRFVDEARAFPSGPANYFVKMYDGMPLKDGGEDRSEYKKRLDDLNITGTGFRSTSAQTQTLFDYDSQDYKSWVGLTDSILKDFIQQVNAPIRESINTQ